MHSSFSSKTRKLMQRWATPIYLLCFIVATCLSCVPLLDFDPNPWMEFIGAFHPLVLHLPIGTVVLLFCIETIRLFTRGRWNPQTLFIVFFAAFSAVPAVLLGQAAYLALNAPESLEEHMRDGVIFAVLMILVFAVKFRSEQKRSKLVEKVYVALFFITSLMLLSAAHHGGEYTHGSPLEKAPWNTTETKGKKRLIDYIHVNTTESENDVLFYEEIIEPIFAENCYSCHGEKKDKGKFRMHTWELLSERLDSENPLDGDILYSILLPLEEDEHMPPKKETQLTAKQIQLIKWWAENDHVKGKKVSELQVPSELLE